MKSWKCRRRGKFCVIKGSDGCGYLKSPGPTTTNFLPTEANNLSEAALGLDTRYNGLQRWINLTRMNPVATSRKMEICNLLLAPTDTMLSKFPKGWVFRMIPTIAGYVAAKVGVDFCTRSS